MPVIEIKMTEKVAEETKKQLAVRFSDAFRKAGEEIPAQNLLLRIDDVEWICFRGDEKEPSALVTIHPGPMTPTTHYKTIVDELFCAMAELTPTIPKNRIYMTVSQIDYWGFDGGLLE